MINRKYLTSVFIAACLSVSGCISPPQVQEEPTPFNSTASMKKHLQLTTAQIAKIKTINQKYNAKSASLASQDLRFLERKRMTKQLEKTRNMELQQVLSPQQLEIFQQEIKKLRRDKAKKIMWHI
ncbi:hypothetical protein Sps_02175 [Shewanella psychrophila]|uniref:P pilus assembly/Cpx signaling pathway, periplasmic inhibitor/zinc-resistance associated protein n=1 Tax=Shewanella psychrophila TaxID=225848 RepID=A0A1S6HP84_9GAMM|nr:hypothetical protein [Shewanella psychrophila]AQS37333.1 hypothetical protein Sps_02175 [Shewanella psychrophila]